MLTLYITRHGETEWNTQKRMQGWSDSKLTKDGIRNALLLGKRVQEINFDTIYSSPSKRTEITANLIKGDRNIPINLDNNLMEINMGKWEGQTYSSIKDKYPDEFYSFWNTPHLYNPLEGESFAELNNRVLKSLNSIKEKHSSGSILIVIRKAVGAIVFQNNKFLIIHKTKINTIKGKQNIGGEWDFIKSGVEKGDHDLKHSILRELQEETGSTEYRIVKQFDEKICFNFPDSIKEKIGYDEQETTMFLVEYLGNEKMLTPTDNEISDLKFIEKEKVQEILTHQDTKDFFMKYLVD